MASLPALASRRKLDMHPHPALRCRWMPRLLAALLALLALGTPAATAPTPSDLAALYARHVDKRLRVPASEAQQYGTLALQMLQAANITLERPQYLLLVDRSPRVQAALLFWLAPPATAQLIGASPVSTGRTGEYDHFETPTGVFDHTTLNLDFRAEGTYNDNGIRGFGVQGMRVFDFGWQPARRGWGQGGESPMRLLLHATDPEQLEQRLGSVQSKGCVRIPATLNRLLDQYGVLDADYNDALTEGRRLWVLSPQRVPVADAGRYLVIVDTDRRTRPAWSPHPLRAAPKQRPASAVQGSSTAAPSMAPARNAATAALACANG
jgi:hypothetical protein